MPSSVSGPLGQLPLSPTIGGTGVGNNAASTITISGNFPLTFSLGGSTSVTLPASGTLLAANPSGNVTANSLISGYFSQATAGGSTPLSAASAQQQYFTGTMNQTVVLPQTSTLVLGQNFIIVNNSSGTLTINSFGANLVQTMAASTYLIVTCINIAADTAAAWSPEYIASGSLATPVSLALGGTNANLTASNGGIFWSNATQGQILAGTATASQMLQSGSSASPAWSTSTWPATTTANQILYSSANNTVGQIASAIDGVLITSHVGAPSILANSGTAGWVLTANAGAPPSWQAGPPPSFPITLAQGGTNANLTASNGGIFYSSATAGAILAGTATARQMLQSGSSTTPAWSTATYPATTSVNQILYSSSANVVGEITTAIDGVLITDHAAGVPSILANSATPGWVLTAQAGAPPAWAAAGGGSDPGVNIYCVGPVGQAPYQTLASAVTAATGNTPATIYILPGTYTEDVTWIANLSVIGAEASPGSTSLVSIVGNQLASSGNTSFANINFSSASGITISVSATAFTNCSISSSSGVAISGIPNLLNCTVTAVGGYAISSGGSSGTDVITIYNSKVSSSTTDAIFATSSSFTCAATISDSIISSSNSTSFGLHDGSGGQATYNFNNSQFTGGASGGGIFLDGGFNFGGPLDFTSKNCLYKGGTGIKYTAYSGGVSANSYNDIFNASGTYIITGAFPFYYSGMTAIGATSAIDPTATINQGTTPGAIGQYLSGVAGFTTSNTNMVTINTVTGQLGSAAVPSGSGIGTLTGNGAGGATGATVDLTTGSSNANGTALFSASMSAVTLGATSATLFCTGWGLGALSAIPASPTNADSNTAFGANALHSLTDITGNTFNCAFGADALRQANGTGGTGITDCIAIGYRSMYNYIGGAGLGNGTSVAIGREALTSATTLQHSVAIGSNSIGNSVGGTDNTAVGFNTLSDASLTTQSFNSVFGSGAGRALTTTDSSNICINSYGVSGDNNTLRIGLATGSSDQYLAAAYIQGIAGVTVASSAAVLINTSTGQLGTVISAARFKENIEDMEDESEVIYKLRPVRYNLKDHPEFGIQTGLVADEVQKVAPRLVSVTPTGEPASVAYHELPAMLLNEIQKLRARIEVLEAR